MGRPDGREPVLFFFGIVAAIGAIAAMAFGVVVVVHRYFPNESAEGEGGGYKFKAPVGIWVFVAGLAALVALVWIYSKGVEAENDRLTTERDQYKTELDTTTTDRNTKERELRQARTEADNEKRNAADLATRLEAEKAERRQAQEFASSTWLANDWQALSPDQRAELDKYRQGVLALNNQLTQLYIRAGA